MKAFSGNNIMCSILDHMQIRILAHMPLRSAVTTYGLWDQIRVDHGREFYLTLFIQEQLRRNHGPPNISAYVQSPSTEAIL